MDIEIIIYIVLITGFTCASLTVHASQHAKKNNYQHTSRLSLYIHLASTLSMYALLAWSILEVEWWIPLVIVAFLYQLSRLVVTSSNWQLFFNAIPFTGSATTAITIGAWVYWALSQ